MTRDISVTHGNESIHSALRFLRREDIAPQRHELVLDLGQYACINIFAMLVVLHRVVVMLMLVISKVGAWALISVVR